MQDAGCRMTLGSIQPQLSSESVKSCMISQDIRYGCIEKDAWHDRVSFHLHSTLVHCRS